MSREYPRKTFYVRERDRDRDWGRNDYRYEKRRSRSRKRSRSPPRDHDKRRSRTPRKIDKDLLDENILSEISKLPEPSELWDNQTQDAGYTGPPPPPFPQEGSNYGSNYQSSYPAIYDDFPSINSMPAAPHPPEMSSWNQMSIPPAPAPPVYNIEDQIKKEAAIETEMRHQKAALSKQREDYIKKAGILKKELDTLKDQRNELRGDSKRTPSPDTKRFLKENTKLQLEIQNKLKTINNVVDMLNGIIGEDAQELIEMDDSDERASKRKSRSPSGQKFNYVYYDPEMHWCRVCNEFPPTAKEYLNHLHSPAHHKAAAAHLEAPWHALAGHEGFPSLPHAPAKRTPIRGLQFFVPSTAWYCKLCDQFIGDLHCASAHLKSIVHSKNYTNFVEQNPHWETDWMSDRQKAFEKARGKKAVVREEEKPSYANSTITFSEDGITTRAVSPRKKKKRRRSTSSSSSDSEPRKKKKSKKSKTKYGSDDKLNEWMSSIQVDRLDENDRKLLDKIKTRINLDKQQSGRTERSERQRSERSEQRELSRGREQERRESRAREEREKERREEREKERREEREKERREEREKERREARERERREEARRREERREDRRDERRDERKDEREDRGERRGEPSREDPKKPDIRKMPFIGKMPVYKNLSKNSKVDDVKKDDQKKKEDEEINKKRREMDVEIQKKVAEFKEKIAKAQLEREQELLLPLPRAFLPHAPLAPQHPPHQPLAPQHPPHQPLAPQQPPHQPLAPQHPPHQPLAPQHPPHQPLAPQQPQPPPPATSAPPPTLPKDFQDALDIIFPSAEKTAEMAAQQELFQGIPGLPPPGFPVGLGGVMPSFPQLSILGQPPPHMMMGFDMNPQLFQHPQLYDTHVPIVPNQKQRQNKNRRNQKNGPDKKNNQAASNNTNVSLGQAETTNSTVATTAPSPRTTTTASAAKPTTASTRNKEELDDLAMLGIDADDVGAGR